MNADDFALSAGVNRGILACFHHGILRSTSLMPNGAAFDDAVQLARQTPDLGVGVHLALVGEKCVAPRAQLGHLVDDEGNLPASYAAFARGYLMHRFTLRAIEREIAAQMERVLATGLRPTHLDSHQHVHLLPGIFALTVRAAKNVGIPVIRVPGERIVTHQRTMRETLSAWNARALQLRVLTRLCRRARCQARAAHLRTVDNFRGLQVSGALDEPALLRIIHRLPRGVSEVMSHPGFGSAALHQKYPWNYRWDDEAAALQSDTVRRAVENQHIRLAHFGNAWQ